MTALVLTNIYLEDVQRKAISKKAKANGTNVSVEIRKAIDAYLAGMSVEDLRMLDGATRKAKAEIDEMNAILDAGQRRAVAFFAEIEKIRRTSK
jgi:ATP/maltotriose-dependent transcriptional regulator MalT